MRKPSLLSPSTLTARAQWGLLGDSLGAPQPGVQLLTPHPSVSSQLASYSWAPRPISRCYLVVGGGPQEINPYPLWALSPPGTTELGRVTRAASALSPTRMGHRSQAQGEGLPTDLWMGRPKQAPLTLPNSTLSFQTPTWD